MIETQKISDIVQVSMIFVADKLAGFRIQDSSTGPDTGGANSAIWQGPLQVICLIQ